MRRRTPPLAAASAALLVALALFAGSASATFEATMALRTPSARKTGPIFTVEAGGGRRPPGLPRLRRGQGRRHLLPHRLPPEPAGRTAAAPARRRTARRRPLRGD